jgi:hypothetical protein
VLGLRQGPIEKFESVLTPEELTGRQHIARRTEDAAGKCLDRILVVESVEFLVRGA